MPPTILLLRTSDGANTCVQMETEEGLSIDAVSPFSRTPTAKVATGEHNR